jgi:hypothetical protein
MLSMDLRVNEASDECQKRVSVRHAEVGRAIDKALSETAIDSSTYSFDHAADDPFAFDLSLHNCRAVTYVGGIALAVRLQNALREFLFDGWRVRIWIQPDSEDLVLDYVIWLVVDVIRVSEYRGGRLVEMFKDSESFQRTCWGRDAA